MYQSLNLLLQVGGVVPGLYPPCLPVVVVEVVGGEVVVDVVVICLQLEIKGDGNEEKLRKE